MLLDLFKCWIPSIAVLILLQTKGECRLAFEETQKGNFTLTLHDESIRRKNSIFVSASIHSLGGRTRATGPWSAMPMSV
jgi:hypothetical protein